MFDRHNLVVEEFKAPPCSNLQQSSAQRQYQDEVVSRVSTDSDLDLESEDDDDYRSTFSDLLMRRLVAVERAQQQHVLREEKLTRSGPLQLLADAADDSYWEKMRRVSLWRQSTHQSETTSEYSPPLTASRKRRLSDAASDASVPSSSKRVRVTSLSPAPPGPPFFPNPRMYPLDSPKDKKLNPAAYPRSYAVRVELNIQAYPSSDWPHVCTACDTTFDSRQRLRRHGRGVWTPDACRAAVTYGLE